MKKIETIWHHVLQSAVTERRYRHTQKDLAALFDYSLSTVHHALEVPSAIGAVRKEGKFFVLQDFWKLLSFSASMRTLERDILSIFPTPLSVRQIEGIVPPESIFGAYSAAAQHLDEPPADYDKVYVYLPAERLPDARQRFPAGKGSNMHDAVVLRMHPAMTRYGPLTTLVQTYIDIWNLRDWYARDFLTALDARLHELLS